MPKIRFYSCGFQVDSNTYEITPLSKLFEPAEVKYIWEIPHWDMYDILAVMTPFERKKWDYIIAKNQREVVKNLMNKGFLKNE